MPGYNVLNDELTQRVKQVVNQYMACNQLRPQPGRRRRGGGGGGGSTANVTAFAIVVQQASPSNSGYAVLLDPKMIPRDEDDNVLGVRPTDPGYDPAKIDAVKLPFFCGHTDAKCPQYARVRLFATAAIKPGDDADPEHPIWGLCVDPSDYWGGHDTYGTGRVVAAQNGKAAMRDLNTGEVDVSGGGTGGCNSSGGVDVTLDVTATGGPFVKPFAD